MKIGCDYGWKKTFLQIVYFACGGGVPAWSSANTLCPINVRVVAQRRKMNYCVAYYYSACIVYLDAANDADEAAAAVAVANTASHDSTPNINNWKAADVGNWLLSNNLEHLQTWYDKSVKLKSLFMAAPHSAKSLNKHRYSAKLTHLTEICPKFLNCALTRQICDTA